MIPSAAPNPTPAAPATPSVPRLRVALVYVVFVLFFLLIAARLVQLQILPNPELEAMAQRQLQRIGKVAPYRLPIYDRNGEELAVSLPASSAFTRPKLVRNKRRTARILSTILGASPAHWLAKLDSPRPFVWLHRQLDNETAKRLSDQDLPGVFLQEENRRVYPNGNLAAQVLGFTDIDGNGLAGLELSLNGELLQEPSKFTVLRDGRGIPSYLDKRYERRGLDHKGVYLTIDRRLQDAVEQELDHAMEETGAAGAMAVVMDPRSGELFALAQRPTFDANRLNRSAPDAIANRLISRLYEPGSTMKVLMSAEAIERGLLKASSPIDCEGGHLTIGKKTIGEAEATHRFGVLPLEKVIRFSSNVGAVKVGRVLGAELVRGVLDTFGLTSKTGIRLPGEISAAPRPDEFWTPIHLATASFGQGVSVTPLQMVSAYAPIANGGLLVKPRILMDDSSASPDEKKRVLSKETVSAMRAILASVTEEEGGTGHQARVTDVRVGGKTGTAQKYDPKQGYGAGKYFASFIGFLPVESPSLLIGVMIDEPKKSVYTGGLSAAPVFRRIAERALPILDRQPQQKIASIASAPIPTAAATRPALPKLIDLTDESWLMPDLKGISMREAIQLLGTHVDHVKLSGTGYLSGQSPEAGAQINRKSHISLQFTPAG